MRFLVTGDTLEACQKQGIKTDEVTIVDVTGDEEKWQAIVTENLSDLEPITRNGYNLILDFNSFHYDVSYKDLPNEKPVRLKYITLCIVIVTIHKFYFA